MGISHLVGRGFAVDLSLIEGLRVDLREVEGRTDLIIEGSLMESAKVFQKTSVKINDGKIMVTIFASLAFWNRAGKPDFNVAYRLSLQPREYDIVYRDQSGRTTNLKKIKI